MAKHTTITLDQDNHGLFETGCLITTLGHDHWWRTRYYVTEVNTNLKTLTCRWAWWQETWAYVISWVVILGCIGTLAWRLMEGL